MDKHVSDTLIASRKHTRKGDRYITFWGPDRCGYRWPLPSCGLYVEDEAAHIGDSPNDDYPDDHSYAVPLDAVKPFMVMPRVGEIDDNAGPVLRNTSVHWAIIRAHAERIAKATGAAK